MLQGITVRKEISKYRNQLKKKLNEIEDRKITIKYSSKAGLGEPVKASYSEEYNLWWYFSGKEDQYWNPFGLGEPKENQGITGRCQINMPHQGLNRSTAGAFAKDEFGNIYLLHNGTIGGGVKGISKTTFIQWYSGSLNDVYFFENPEPYFIVAEFSSEKFHEQLLFFVQQVYEFKENFIGEAKRKTSKGNASKWLTHGESIYRNPFILPRRTVIRGANHAIITNALIESINNAGRKALRNRFMDAFIINQDEKDITHLFEVKSKLDTQSFYTAIGQLTIYGLSHRAKRILVVEEDIRKDFVMQLVAIGIICLTYRWKKKKPIFKDLTKLLI